MILKGIMKLHNQNNIYPIDIEDLKLIKNKFPLNFVIINNYEENRNSSITPI